MNGKTTCSGFVRVEELPLQVPVEIKPRVCGGRARVITCGAPCVAPARDGGCGYVLRQHLCVEIPLRVGASATVGDVRVCPGQQSMEWGMKP